MKDINLNDLLTIIFIIHSIIVILILYYFFKDKKSINYSIKRYQLLFIILSIWILLFIYKNKNINNSNNDEYL